MKRGLWTRVRTYRAGPELIAVAVIGSVAFLLGALYSAKVIANEDFVFYVPTTGRSWKSPLVYGILQAAYTIGLYGLVRLVARRAVAWGVLLFAALSPLQTFHLISSPSRDFPRSLAIFAIVFLLGLVVRSGDNRRIRIWAPAGAAVVCTLGRFIREDIPLYVVLGSVMLLIHALADLPSRRLKGFVPLGTFLLVTLMLAKFPLVGFGAQNSIAGFMQDLDSELELTRPDYDTGSLFIDEHITHSYLLNVQSEFSYERLWRRPTSTPESGSKYLRKYLKQFPADFLVRCYASHAKLIGLPFEYRLAPQGSGPLAHTFYRGRGLVLALLSRVDWILMLAAWVILLYAGWHYFATYAAVVGFVGFLSTAQFFGRNYFYLESLAWIHVALVCQAIFVGWERYQRTRRTTHVLDTSRLLLSCATSLGIVAILAGALTLTRSIQRAQVRATFEEYAAIPAGDIPGGLEESDDEILLPRGDARPQTHFGAPAQMFLLDLGGPDCSTDHLWPNLEYGMHERLDWSRVLSVSTESQGLSRVVFPAWHGFRGVRLPAEFRGCVRAFQPVELPEETFRLTARVQPGARQLYKKLERWERDEVASFVPGVPSLEEFQKMMEQARQLGEQGSHYLAENARWDGSRLLFEGYARTPVDPHQSIQLDRTRSVASRAWYGAVGVSFVDTDVLIDAPRRLKRGDAVLVEGQLQTGGISVGLLEGTTSAGAVMLSARGRFRVYLPVLHDGAYQFGVAHRLSWYTSLESRFRLDRVVLCSGRGNESHTCLPTDVRADSEALGDSVVRYQDAFATTPM